MVVETVEAAFHYPQDFSYVIQNFSAIQYAKIVKPKQQATVSYSFVPAEPFAGRPFGLSVSLGYRSAVSLGFQAVFIINILSLHCAGGSHFQRSRFQRDRQHRRG